MEGYDPYRKTYWICDEECISADQTEVSVWTDGGLNPCDVCPYKQETFTKTHVERGYHGRLIRHHNDSRRYSHNLVRLQINGVITTHQSVRKERR